MNRVVLLLSSLCSLLIYTAEANGFDKPKYSRLEPCSVLAQIQHERGNTPLPADATLECLRSVPLDVQGGNRQIAGLAIFAEFQTTLAYLKNPPKGYLYPPTDIIGGLQQISAHLNNSHYGNEYDFQLDIYKLFASAFDGHLRYVPDIVGAFTWTRTLNLQSISTDGLELPNVYTTSDLALLDSHHRAVSPVVKINNQDVQAWLNQFAALNAVHQDPDANYNALFPIIPLQARAIALGQESTQGSVNASVLFQGNDTTLMFQNGSQHTIRNAAYTNKNLTGVKDGKTFFDRFCRGSTRPSAILRLPSSSQASYTPVPSQTTLASPQTYPKAWILASDYSIGGYFSEDAALAILSVPTFEPRDYVEFENVVREFLATCKVHGKSKLVIDLRGNGGGDVMLAYDMFKQLFPELVPFGGTNLRAHTLFDQIGKILSTYYQDDQLTLVDLISASYRSVFNLQADLTRNNAAFGSWKDLYGPYSHHHDQFTSIVRWNLSSVAVTGIAVSDYGSLSGIVPNTTFAAENILLLQDGYCSSTCAIFTEFMRAQGHVKQVAFGGRKQSGPMQGVGGVKGARVMPFQTIRDMMSSAWSHATAEQRANVRWNYSNMFNTTQQALERAAVSSTGALEASVNFRNNLRRGDETATPLQFVYEAANCRLFYTADQTQQQSLVWQAASDAVWGNASCIQGSDVYVPTGAHFENPPANARNMFGAEYDTPYPNDLTLTSSTSSTSTSSAVSNTPVKSSHSGPEATEKSMGLRVSTSMIFMAGAISLNLLDL